MTEDKKMTKEEMTTITVKKNIWEKLQLLKIASNKRSISEVITDILNKEEAKNDTTRG